MSIPLIGLAAAVLATGVLVPPAAEAGVPPTEAEVPVVIAAGFLSSSSMEGKLGATEISNTSVPSLVPPVPTTLAVSSSVPSPPSLGLRAAEEGVVPLVLAVIADNGGSFRVSCAD